MAALWWLRQARALGDPRAGRMAGRVLLKRSGSQRAARLAHAGADAAFERVRRRRPRMRALVLGAGGRLSFRSVPEPAPPGPLGAVVRPLAIATCDLDRALALGATPFPAPLHFGHECVAEVERVGEDVRRFGAGDRVVVPFQISCGECAACRGGHTGNCRAVPPVSMYGFGVAGGHWGGALSERIAVPFADAMLIALPDGLDPVAVASVADNVCDGYRHIAPHLPSLLAREPGARVVIVGALHRHQLPTASVPLYAGLVAIALGARDVALADARAHVRSHAEALGLQALVPRQLRGVPPAPLVVDASTTPAGLRLALARTAPDGICSSVGTLHPGARLPVGLMYGRNVTLRIARTHARALIPEVLTMIAAGRLAPERVTTAVASFDDAPAALAEHVRGAGTKTVVAGPA
jgi:alcohol dehydrogenase